jgi:hypothetical protein
MKLKKLWLQTPRYSRSKQGSKYLIPDGVRIRVDWSKFPTGASVFIPCVNTLECVRQVNQITQELGWSMHYNPQIERGLWGVRIWRLL